ncbi:MAG: hypothetical protein ACXADH_12995, partial [Candidatus Kariarchaeaceae archaeon]
GFPCTAADDIPDANSNMQKMVRPATIDKVCFVIFSLLTRKVSWLVAPLAPPSTLAPTLVDGFIAANRLKSLL